MSKLGKILIIALIIAIFTNGYMPYVTIRSDAAEIMLQEGASMYPVSTTDFASETFKKSLFNLHSTGANTVSLIIPYYQKTASASEIYAGTNTPTDASLIAAITYAHSLNMKVMLKPHLETENGSWRANIFPKDRTTWFISYGAMLNKLATIAEEHDVEGICIGTELISAATYTSHRDNTDAWITMIDQVRSRYSGFLTYSANWGGSDYLEEAPHIAFWDHLDFIGISAYYPLALETNDPTLYDVIDSWRTWDETKITPLYTKYEKKILFTEVGYRSQQGIQKMPWDASVQNEISEANQAMLYEALFHYWKGKHHFEGVHIWNWETNPEAGGASNNHYTPQHKLAEVVMNNWFYGTSRSLYFKTELLSDIPFRTDAESISIKALIPNINPAQYTMYWQVDGGSLVPMQLVLGHTPHYETAIGLTDWTWNTTGTYTINLVSKDTEGKIISQKAIPLTVENF